MLIESQHLSGRCPKLKSLFGFVVFQVKMKFRRKGPRESQFCCVVKPPHDAPQHSLSLPSASPPCGSLSWDLRKLCRKVMK